MMSSWYRLVIRLQAPRQALQYDQVPAPIFWKHSRSLHVEHGLQSQLPGKSREEMLVLLG